MKRIKVLYHDLIISADKTEARVYPRQLFANSYWDVLSLRYFKINDFDYKAIAINCIDSMEEH